MLYIPCKDKEEASKISKELLDGRLIACANLHTGDSLYHWEGKLAEETETILVAKTLPEKEAEVRKKITELHSYEIPCIASWKIKVNQEYGEWVMKETSPG